MTVVCVYVCVDVTCPRRSSSISSRPAEKNTYPWARFCRDRDQGQDKGETAAAGRCGSTSFFRGPTHLRFPDLVRPVFQRRPQPRYLIVRPSPISTAATFAAGDGGGAAVFRPFFGRGGGGSVGFSSQGGEIPAGGVCVEKGRVEKG